jgi:hypothetical protein
VFEIGCGRGEIGPPTCWHASQITKIVAHRGYNLYGSDLHELKWTHPNFHYIRGNFLDVQLDEHSFNAGYAVQVISHIGMQYFQKRGNEPYDERADFRVWSKISKLLKPNGVFITGMPFAEKYTTYIPKILPRNKGRVYDEKRLNTVLSEAGLKIVKKEFYSGWNPKLEDKPIKELDDVNLILLVVSKQRPHS